MPCRHVQGTSEASRLERPSTGFLMVDGRLQVRNMTKNQPAGIIERLLETEEKLDFLCRSDEEQLIVLTVCIRGRVDRLG